jgi:hypothetical protein
MRKNGSKMIFFFLFYFLASGLPLCPALPLVSPLLHHESSDETETRCADVILIYASKSSEPEEKENDERREKRSQNVQLVAGKRKERLSERRRNCVI